MVQVEHRNISGGKNEITFPSWLPDAALNYLEHTETGLPLRQMARQKGLHASTILRQVRRLETRRDDPLMDEALLWISRQAKTQSLQHKREDTLMGVRAIESDFVKSELIDKEARRILRRLCETTAFLAIAPKMAKAVVMRETVKGRPIRTAVLDRNIAHAFILKDWIAVFRRGKVASYEITSVGRAALKRLLADDLLRRPSGQGFAETQTIFSEQHKDWQIQGAKGEGGRTLRFNLAESPMTAVGRRKDKDGKNFLSHEQMQAGDRLREDFELAQMGPRITQNWDSFLTAGHSGGVSNSGVADGPMAARERVAGALRALGPGLGDIALRCCCFLEGMETAEKRMGWSARSGKIVLRISLQRLRLHYDGASQNDRLIG